ncbi:cyclase family protein [Acuticoccus sp.]|uniref:cyclase family protein n=1 Tax=Acuticoccus sp. TaxID=1904378 RepID=UPI003B51BE81
MPQRWTNRPPGSNWGDFGLDDEIGRLNLLTPERVRRAAEEVREGVRFCLSLPLDLPGGMVLNNRRHPPQLIPIQREGRTSFNLPLEEIDPGRTDVVSDEAFTLHSQYSTQWDSLAHIGSMFDADGDGTPERVFYNGWRIVGEDGRGRQGEVGALALGIETVAAACVQGRGVMVDLHAHFGEAREAVGHDSLMGILEADGVAVEEGDILCLHTGLCEALLASAGRPDPELRTRYPVLDGTDARLLQWITDSGVAAIASDALAVEASSQLASSARGAGPVLPLHEHCLFKLGVPLGELWYLTELAAWLKEHGRFRFFLTAPPLRLPGAAGSPVTPIATV